MIAPHVGLVAVLGAIGLMAIAGGVSASVARTWVAKNQKVFEVLAALLMMLLASHLLWVGAWETRVWDIPSRFLIMGFTGGAAGAAVAMVLLHSVRKRHDPHVRLGIILVAMLALHEVMEGAAIAEVFYELGGMSVPIVASVVSVGILAVHEFPEGIMLALPFVLARRIKEGILALLANQALFMGSGIAFYSYLFHLKEFALHEEMVLSTIPAGAVFILGVSELFHALNNHHAVTRTGKRLLWGVMVSMAIGFWMVFSVSKTQILEHARPSVSGPIIPADPCEQTVDVSDCLH